MLLKRTNINTNHIKNKFRTVKSLTVIKWQLEGIYVNPIIIIILCFYAVEYAMTRFVDVKMFIVVLFLSED